MLRQLVAGWLRQQAQDTLARRLHPDPVSSPPSPPRRCEIAVFLPTRAEAGGLVDLLREGNTTRCSGFVEHTGRVADRTLCIVEATVPPDQLARITRDVIGLRKPRWFISAGFAVALRDHLGKGDMLMARRVVDTEGYALQTGLQLDKAMPLSKGVHVGELLTVSALPSTLDAKQALARQHQSLACARQSAIAAEVCRVLHVPMLGVHTISEAYQDQSATTVRRVESQSSLAAKLGAAAGALIDRPSSVKQYFVEKEAALRLSDRLAAFLKGVLQNLPSSTS